MIMFVSSDSLTGTNTMLCDDADVEVDELESAHPFLPQPLLLGVLRL